MHEPSTPHDFLKLHWGYSAFRPMQEDIINAVLEKKDTLALLPTGGGKSICYQVPALVMPGICIVVSPLIALMKDQVGNLNARGIKAISLVSGMTKREIDIALDNCIYGDYKFLYISPERLAAELFIERLKLMPVNLLAIDEAHCISQWGHDFRPPYRQIAKIKEHIPGVPVLALTATATEEVRDDICVQLEMKNPCRFTASFARSNLSYAVLHDDNKFQRMLKVFKGVSGCGIVYVRNRRRTQEISDWLVKNNISSTFYHAGLPRELRNKRQDEWMQNKVRVIVATNAFGMGIDKPDVRIVIHADLPDNLESYYQEAGRVGRDGKHSFAVALYTEADVSDLINRAQNAVPEKSEIIRIYKALSNYLQIALHSGYGETYDFDIAAFTNNYQLSPASALQCLKMLELTEYISLSDSFYMPSRLHFEIGNMDLYKFQVEQVRYDHLIKTLLRTYEGLFDRFADINENDLALKAGLPKVELIQQLKQLEHLNVISYQPSSDQPRISFLQPRLPDDELVFPASLLTNRKKRILESAQKMKRYITDHFHCRSVMLLEYFNETADQRCGTCDYCRQLNKLELNDLEFKMAEETIRQHLEDKAVSLHDLAALSAPVKEENLAKVIQFMMDNSDVRINSNGLLELVK
ncbi:MAG: ATP-dependent DNA helicase RecQ [Bacteroidota bacterium]